MEYFESDAPASDGLCSDNTCPCPEVKIPRGAGYLYISQDLVDFRRQYPTLQTARQAIQKKHSEIGLNLGSNVSGIYTLGPILVCERGAKLRKLDLKVAASDAEHWWRTGQVPLRATPTAGPYAEQSDNRTKTDKIDQSAPNKEISSQRMSIQPAGEPIINFQPIGLTNQDEITDLNCPNCPDVDIPSEAVFLLDVLGKSIPCPLCGSMLRVSSACLESLDLASLTSSAHMTSEEAILEEVKRLDEISKDKLQPVMLANTLMVPVEKQLAGRLLLKWLEINPKPSEAIVNALVGNWAGHLPLSMLATDSFKKLSTEELEGFYVIMHYGSAFIHQVDLRIGPSKIGHGMRGRLIINLMTSYADWKEVKFDNISYDGRLALEEMAYSLNMEMRANPTDSSKASSWAQFDQALKSVIPAAKKAQGCLKSVPREETKSDKKSGCFVATAAFSVQSEEVEILRRFRDRILKMNPLGQRFIRWYYSVGPAIARPIAANPIARFVSRICLHPFVYIASKALRYKKEDNIGV